MTRLASLCTTVLIAAAAAAAAFAAEPAASRVYDAWPFDAAEAARRQAETAKALHVPDALKVSVGADQAVSIHFRLIPAGRFDMGSPTTEPGHEGDETIKPTVIDEPFYMMETQLTLGAYRALLKADPPGAAAGDDATLPAGVTYRDAVDNVLPALARLAPPGWKVILPDQARLEYAARAGVATMNPGGNAEKDAADYAWTKGNSENKVHAVAQKKPNAWGLYDVIGNRWHWVWWGPGGNGDASKGNHIVYGGSYNTPANGNGARLANIMVSNKPEGARYALIRAAAALPKGHPDTADH